MRRKILYWLVIFTKLFSRFLTFRLAQKTGALLGLLAYYVVAKYRKLAEKNLLLCFNIIYSSNSKNPSSSKNKKVKHLTKNVFVNQGRNFFELLCLNKLNSKNIDRYVKLSGRENLKDAFARNKGIIILAAHFGNWELMGAALSLLGYPISVIARKVYIEGLEKLLLKIRKSKGMKVITRGESNSPKGILRALRRNEAIGILIDQNTKSVPGMYVNFFNRKAYTPTGLATLALKTGASVVPGFIVRQKNNRHIIEISKPLELIQTQNESDDIKRNTQLFTDIIESYVKKYPEQWVWFHNRWD